MSDTWKYDGTTWQQRSSGGPKPRWDAAMTYDAARGEVVLYGGTEDQGTFGDTWVWNGSYWREHFGIAGPGPRGCPSMTFDDRRCRVILFGGDSNDNDTWEWDGSSWTKVQTATMPILAGATLLAFDRRRDVAVLFGETNQGAGQTWEYLVGAAASGSRTPFGTGCSGSVGVPTLAPVGGQQPTVGDAFAVAVQESPPACWCVRSACWVGRTPAISASRCRWT